jgi:NTE family protein
MATNTPRPNAPDAPDPRDSALGLVLTGGGARGAYQVGVLRTIARHFPDLPLPILTGVSAGAVNASFLAQYDGPRSEAIEALARLWGSLSPEAVFRVDTRSLAGNIARWGTRLLGAGRIDGAHARGMVDTEPLRQTLMRGMRTSDGTLPGIARNLDRGALRAIALGTTNYTTGQSVVFAQGREIDAWERPQRRAVPTMLGIDHVMASAALPLLFPAVPIGREWFGDGGIRLTAPLSPALHLGATHLLTVSTRYARRADEARRAEVHGYPPPAQVLGVLYNSIFLDLIDQDVLRLTRLNRVLAELPPERRQGLRIVEIFVIRPSQDLGMLAREYEPRLPRVFKLLTRGLGTRETSSPDVLSLILFQADYVRHLMALGEADAEARIGELTTFLQSHRYQVASSGSDR